MNGRLREFEAAARFAFAALPAAGRAIREAWRESSELHNAHLAIERVMRSIAPELPMEPLRPRLERLSKAAVKRSYESVDTYSRDLPIWQLYNMVAGGRDLEESLVELELFWGVR